MAGSQKIIAFGGGSFISLISDPRHLSMGMSNDFEPAIAEGATMVRIGTLLFGGKVVDEQMSEE